MIGYTDGTQPADSPRRVLVISDDATFSDTSDSGSTAIQSTDSPTAASLTWADFVYKIAIHIDDIKDDYKDIRKLIRAVELIEYHHKQGRREYYQKKICKALVGSLFSCAFNRRLMRSRSGYLGLKGAKYRN